MSHDPGATSSASTPAASPPAPSQHVTPAVLQRVADQRTRLQLLATALAQALTPDAVAGQVLEAAMAAMDAPMGWITALSEDGEHVEILAAAGYPTETISPWMRVPLSADVPMTVAVRTGEPQFHASAADRHGEFPAVVVPGVPLAGAEGSAVMPMHLEGRTIGAIGLAWATPRAVDPDERWFLGALAYQGSAALDRARLFRELRDQEERLQYALEASGIGSWEWRLADDRFTWSPVTCALHGLSAGETPAGLEAWLVLVHPDDRPGVIEAIGRVFAEGGRYETELRILLRDGSIRWLASSGRLFGEPGERPTRMLGTVRDITDRKLAEAARERTIAAEREAARLREAFIGVVSHELRTPITTIFGGTRVLARRWREMEPAARDDLLGDVVEEADRLYRLVEDLLVITRVEGGNLDVGDEPVHPGRVLERVVASEQVRWPDVTFEAHAPHGLPSAVGEDAYLEQILRNLLGNAAKYGGPGSTVRVTAEATPDRVCVEVADEGPGIDEAEASELFDLFYRSPTTAATVPGAGIGLFVCRQLAQAMGGEITAHRGPNGGAVFRLCLARYADDDESGA